MPAVAPRATAPIRRSNAASRRRDGGRARAAPRERGRSRLPDLDLLPLPELFETLLPEPILVPMLRRFMEEDVGPGDVTSRATIPASARGTARVVARRACVLAGLDAAALLALDGGRDLMVAARVEDGDRIAAGATVAVLEGNLRDILAVERCVLNLLGRLSGVATATAAFVSRLAGTGARLLDTRKTTPGLRLLEKYAVRCGGGSLHRLGLWDAVLIKDNHLASIGRADAVARALRAVRRMPGRGRMRFVELEVDTLDQLRQALRQPRGMVDVVLLDNMTLPQLRAAVAMRRRLAPQVALEASGGVTLRNAAAIARTGVDRISTGAVTHSAASIDFGLDFAVDLSALAPRRRAPSRRAVV